MVGLGDCDLTAVGRALGHGIGGNQRLGGLEAIFKVLVWIIGCYCSFQVEDAKEAGGAACEAQ